MKGGKQSRNGDCSVASRMDAYLVRSFDGGRTWSAPEKSPIREKHPTLTALSDGTVVCTYPRRHAKPYGYRARFTSDLGKTWSEEIIIRDNLEYHELPFPLTVELSDGTLFTAYSFEKDIDEAPVFGNTKLSKARRVLSGTRWSRNYQRTRSFDLPRPPRKPVDNRQAGGQSPWDQR